MDTAGGFGAITMDPACVAAPPGASLRVTYTRGALHASRRALHCFNVTGSAPCGPASAGSCCFADPAAVQLSSLWVTGARERCVLVEWRSQAAAPTEERVGFANGNGLPEGREEARGRRGVSKRTACARRRTRGIRARPRRVPVNPPPPQLQARPRAPQRRCAAPSSGRWAAGLSSPRPRSAASVSSSSVAPWSASTHRPRLRAARTCRGCAAAHRARWRSRRRFSRAPELSAAALQGLLAAK
jgi:hypothetical protein